MVRAVVDDNRWLGMLLSLDPQGSSVLVLETEAAPQVVPSISSLAVCTSWRCFSFSVFVLICSFYFQTVKHSSLQSPGMFVF